MTRAQHYALTQVHTETQRTAGPHDDPVCTMTMAGKHVVRVEQLLYGTFKCTEPLCFTRTLSTEGQREGGGIVETKCLERERKLYGGERARGEGGRGRESRDLNQ